MANFIRDLLDLLHEDWMPEEKKDALKRILMDCVDNFEVMNKDLEPMR